MIFDGLEIAESATALQYLRGILNTEIFHHDLLLVFDTTLLNEERISIPEDRLLIHIKDRNSIVIGDSCGGSNLLLGPFDGSCRVNLDRVWQVLDRFFTSCNWLVIARISTLTVATYGDSEPSMYRALATCSLLHLTPLQRVQALFKEMKLS
jgi:hypothetical protein